ncbi:hypothetical protein BC629DRAFT_600 [Irpex lacteus]|nr:hypothetical protein BC629DRAFT_600 [Irpex lacteus]
MTRHWQCQLTDSSAVNTVTLISSIERHSPVDKTCTRTSRESKGPVSTPARPILHRLRNQRNEDRRECQGTVSGCSRCTTICVFRVKSRYVAHCIRLPTTWYIQTAFDSCECKYLYKTHIKLSTYLRLSNGMHPSRVRPSLSELRVAHCQIYTENNAS